MLVRVDPRKPWASFVAERLKRRVALLRNIALGEREFVVVRQFSFLSKALFQEPIDFGEIARTIDDTHDVHDFIHQPIKRQPSINDENPCVRCNFRAGRAKLPMISQKLTCFLDSIVYAVCDRFGILTGNIQPDFEQIFARAACKMNFANELTLSMRPVVRALSVSMP